jgi:signal peptide peptidase SppA
MTLPLSRLWACEPNTLDEILANYARFSQVLPIQAAAVDAKRGQPSLWSRVDDVAVIELRGTMVKYSGFFTWFLGGTSTLQLIEAVHLAAADERVKKIILRVDSPGGETAGVDDLAEAVFAARGSKRVVAVIEDFGASASYYIASQAHQVVVGSASLVGSIGVYAVVDDLTGMRERIGVTRYVIRSGEFKGLGLDQITDEQRAELQRTINALGFLFAERVARGRRMSMHAAREVSDGRVWVGKAAISAGLADRIASFETVLGELRQPVAPPPKPTATPGRLTLAELQKMFPTANAGFWENCLRCKWSRDECLHQFELEKASNLYTRPKYQGVH